MCDAITATTEQLVEELKNGILSTVQSFIRLAGIWAELDRRGYDLTSLKVGIARTLPLIASGKLAAEAVVAFMDRPAIIRRLECMPLEQQKKIANGEPVMVYVPGEKEAHSTSLVDAPHHVAARVIAPNGHIRSPNEQRMNVRVINEKVKHRESPVRVTSRRIFIGKKSASIENVVSSLVEAAGGYVEVVETDGRPACVVAGKVTDDEKERIKAVCKAKNLTESELVRRAVIAMWLS